MLRFDAILDRDWKDEIRELHERIDILQGRLRKERAQNRKEHAEMNNRIILALRAIDMLSGVPPAKPKAEALVILAKFTVDADDPIEHAKPVYRDVP